MPRPDLRPESPQVWIALAAALLSLIPVLMVPIPGFVDVPAHMARHHILAMADFGGPLSRHFAVHWQWMANLGEDIPAAVLGRWLGGEAATRLISALIAPLSVAGIVALSRAAHGRVAASAVLAMPLVFHQAWMYGFLNYCLGTALAMLVGAWLLARKAPTVAGQVGLALAALAVWTAHMASWGVLLLLAVGSELATMRGWRDLGPAIRRNWPLLVPLVPLLFWRAHSGGSDFSLVYEDGLRDKAAVFAAALRGTWMKLDLALLMAVASAALLALRWSRGQEVDGRLFIPGLLLAGVALVAPTYLLASWGTDLRTAPFAIVLFILSIRPADPRRERIICAIGLALFLVRLTSVTWTWAHRSPMLEQRLSMLDAVPRGGRLGYLFNPVTCDGWRLQPDEKLASYAVTRREAFVNTLFMVDNARLVTIRAPRLQARWTADSQRVKHACPSAAPDLPALRRSLDAMRQDRFDAIWISGVPLSVVPSVPGYAVVRQLPDETMLVRR